MRTTVVVKPHSLIDSEARLFPRGERETQRVLLLEDAVQAFCVGVLVAVVLFRHADGKVVELKRFHVGMTAVLGPSIGMVYRMTPGWELSQGHLQGTEVGGVCGVLAAVISDDLPREEVHEKNEVLESLIGADEGDITDPNLVWRFRFEVLYEIGEDRKVMP